MRKIGRKIIKVSNNRSVDSVSRALQNDIHFIGARRERLETHIETVFYHFSEARRELPLTHMDKCATHCYKHESDQCCHRKQL